MKHLIFLIVLINLSQSVVANHYVKGSVIFWKRNFQEATAAGNNDGIESTEGGLSVGYGYHFSEKFSLEFEAMNSMKFTVEPPATNQRGEFDVLAFTLAPTYWWQPSWVPSELKFFGKARVGWIKISGIEVFRSNSGDSSLTTGFGVGANYNFYKDLSAYVDLSGLWHHGDIEDYDLFPLMLGLSYAF